jgi:hypothetical protein
MKRFIEGEERRCRARPPVALRPCFATMAACRAVSSSSASQARTADYVSRARSSARRWSARQPENSMTRTRRDLLALLAAFLSLDVPGADS